MTDAIGQVWRDMRPTVPQLLHTMTSLHGERPQIIDAGGAVSFAEVERRSAELASGLLATGIGKGDKVAILMENGADWVICFFAAMRIGAVATPLSTFAKPPELLKMLRQGDVKTILAGDRFLAIDFTASLEAALPGLAGHDGKTPLYLGEAPYLRSIWVRGGLPRWAAGDYRALADAAGAQECRGILAAVEAEVTPADEAIIIFTSGTTSDAKAVLHSHGAMIRQALAIAGFTDVKPGDRFLVGMPFFWVGGIVMVLLPSGIHGAATVCAPAPSPQSALETIRQQGITRSAMWMTQLAAMQALPDFKPEDFANLRPAWALQLADFGFATREQTSNMLGMSETFGPHSIMPIGTILSPEHQGSYGYACAPDLERRVFDPETGQELPAGEEGELWVRGHALMLGFYKRERSDVFTRDGFYRTGDRCRITSDGHLYFTGRTSEMIKTSGANVAPAEVEQALRPLPGVREAIVMGIADAVLGERVIAAVIMLPGSDFDEDAMKAALREQIAGYKVPRAIVPLQEHEVPRTDAGKPKKPILAQALAQRLAVDAAAT